MESEVASLVEDYASLFSLIRLCLQAEAAEKAAFFMVIFL
ncbi:hypothetical protein GPDM_08610 [Planococcus donghaensis MPA1U2]|uniref:Uncharacterized protein n=1 Tax=Planococcus donghaensis MPA1U2 TaxID=933115 RepID=E7RGX4_9BACL|nr:hypothetical protein GPDM_08610 [Planococcus donghaensis MPA1U2]